MALPLISKSAVVFYLGGEIKTKPGCGFPPGVLRFVIEPRCWVMAEVENEGYTRRFYVKDEGNGFWEPFREQESTKEAA